MLANRVMETTVTVGTGTYVLGGAVAGRRTAVAGLGDGATGFFCCESEDGSQYEYLIGVVTAGSPDTLSRSSILASSNSGAAVDWGVGTKYIYATLPAERSLWRDLNDNVSIHAARLGAGTAAAPSAAFTGDTDTGLYNSAANTLAVATEGTLRGYFNSAGLTLIAALTANSLVISEGIAAKYLDLSKASGVYSAITTVVGDGSETYWTLANSLGHLRLIHDATNASIISTQNSKLYFRVNSIYAGFINTDGIQYWATTGVTTPHSSATETGLLLTRDGTVLSGFSLPSHGYILNRNNSSTGSLITCRYNGVDKGSVVSTSGGTAYNVSSDARIKDAIEDLEVDDSWLDNIRPRKWLYNPAYTQSIAPVYGEGFVAQELYNTDPIAVTKGDDNAALGWGDKDYKMWSVDPSKLMAKTIAVLKKQKQYIASLESRIAALEAKIS